MSFRGTLSQRLSVVFSVLLLACCSASAWLQIKANGRHDQEVTQRLSNGLAAHIADNAALVERDGLNPEAVHDLFDKLMAVNPSVEVYLLDLDGRIQAQAAPPGHLKRDRVDVAPIRRLLEGTPLPIVGDDPRGDGVQKVFSAAPLRVDDRDVGYVYVVLFGEDRDAVAANVAANSVLRTTLWSMALVALLGLLAGLAAFHLITRPLRDLTGAVRKFEKDGVVSLHEAGPALERAGRGSDEIATLGQAFAQMTQRIAAQWRELTAQDQQRRELFANISHDLRTPLTSLHGYLETLLIKADALDPGERRRYLEIALAQSRKVARLAQELFELARLEYGVVKPDKETFALADLVQDVFQKFELAAEARHQRLVPDIAPGLPVVTADLGMIERVLTNLLDNAIRHTPEGGEIVVQLRQDRESVCVEVSDTGPGIPGELQKSLFTRPAFSSAGGRSGGLGLVIVQRILQLHGSDIRLLQRAEKGAVFFFQLT
ncbi:sensor histidine kinase [Polaromonas sp. JS666]|uniref:sensor histidine kinase n=1 Tax=Polaromonas sp. (strain JS666 / ATCC BAA-500) TaxID=296591 RepID=UPI0000537E35|nr:HAMP domain-containing sensor histidine kinase [Polaromonas sp. JS666]ABE42504.1 periplasmic sensor signal transduction histidine kinase [Polaromonas sp. JS666]